MSFLDKYIIKLLEGFKKNEKKEGHEQQIYKKYENELLNKNIENEGEKEKVVLLKDREIDLTFNLTDAYLPDIKWDKDPKIKINYKKFNDIELKKIIENIKTVEDKILFLEFIKKEIIKITKHFDAINPVSIFYYKRNREIIYKECAELAYQIDTYIKLQKVMHEKNNKIKLIASQVCSYLEIHKKQLTSFIEDINNELHYYKIL